MFARFDFCGCEGSFGSVDYDEKKILEDLGEHSIVKLSSSKNPGELSYALQGNDEEIAYIYGYIKSATTFKISKVLNCKDDGRGHAYFSSMFRAMESDLKASGIRQITALCVLRLVPLAIKRYGFCTADGKTYEDRQTTWWRYVPRMSYQLTKDLG